jgi:hypothetical protein
MRQSGSALAGQLPVGNAAAVRVGTMSHSPACSPLLLVSDAGDGSRLAIKSSCCCCCRRQSAEAPEAPGLRIINEVRAIPQHQEYIDLLKEVGRPRSTCRVCSRGIKTLYLKCAPFRSTRSTYSTLTCSKRWAGPVADHVQYLK